MLGTNYLLSSYDYVPTTCLKEVVITTFANYTNEVVNYFSTTLGLHVLVLAIKTKHRTGNDTSSHGNLCIAPTTTLLTTDDDIILHISIS